MEQSCTGGRSRELDGEKLCGEEPRDLGRQSAEHEPAVCPETRGPTASWAVLAGSKEVITPFYSAVVRCHLKW